MAATVYGDISFGMQAESGLYVESVQFDTSVESVYIGDFQGEDVAGATFNPLGTFQMTGFTNTGGGGSDAGSSDAAASPLTGESIVLANAIDWDDVIGNGFTSGGTTIIESIKVGLNHREAESRDVSGMFKPFITTEEETP